MALANRVRFEQKYSRRRFSRRDSTNAGNFFRTNSEMLAAFVRELCPCLLILMDAVTKEKRDSPPPQTSSSRVWNVFARDISSQTAENASPRLENRLFQRRAVRRSPLLLLLLLLALESARALVQCTPYNLLEAECFSSVSHFPGRHGIFGKTISSLFRINDTPLLNQYFRRVV